MAMPRKLPVEFGTAFPYGAYAVGEVQPVRDYDKSTRETRGPGGGSGHRAADLVRRGRRR